MTYEEALNYIHTRKRFFKEPTLDRMRTLMHMLGDPQERLNVVHVAGTNGKGSACTMIASILKASGYKTGLTISPYVLEFRERIQINGQMIPKEALAEEITRIKPVAEMLGGVAEFELITAAAYDYFARQGCKAVVAEVGIGGRFDATNVITKPLVSVIMQIGLDHTDMLGDTIEKIAFEKCGIIKPGIPVVTCGGQDLDALAVIMEQACLRGCTIEQPNLNAVKILHMGLDGTDLCLGGDSGLQMHVPLLGRHQVDNTATAVMAAQKALQALGISAQDNAIREGIASVRFPARMELLCKDPIVLLDGAHNPNGAQALAESLPLIGEHPVTAIMGMLADKDSIGSLKKIAPLFRRIYCVKPENPRALKAEKLVEYAREFCPKAAAVENKRLAWHMALKETHKEDGAVVICGSLYLASEMRTVIMEEI